MTVEAGAAARPGRRLALAEASLATDDGTVVLGAQATLLRRGDVALPEAALQPDDDPLPGPEAGRTAQWTGGDETAGFHLTAVELRFVRGDWGRGPGAGWFRLARPLVAGEDAHAAAARRRGRRLRQLGSAARWTSAPTCSSTPT